MHECVITQIKQKRRPTAFFFALSAGIYCLIEDGAVKSEPGYKIDDGLFCQRLRAFDA